MNEGVISTRYARALYLFACDRQQEETVYDEMKCMASQFLLFPELKKYIINPILKNDKKADLLITAAGNNAVSESTKHFISFIIQRDRQDLMPYIAYAYQDVYRKAKNIILVKFTSASPTDQSVLDKVKHFVEDKTKSKVELQSKVDQQLIGGFTLDVDNNRLDSSVLGDLNKIRLALDDK